MSISLKIAFVFLFALHSLSGGNGWCNRSLIAHLYAICPTKKQYPVLASSYGKRAIRICCVLSFSSCLSFSPRLNIISHPTEKHKHEVDHIKICIGVQNAWMCVRGQEDNLTSGKHKKLVWNKERRQPLNL